MRKVKPSNVSEVIPEALRRSRERAAARKARLKALIREGETSGPSVVWDPTWIKAESKRRAGRSVSTSPALKVEQRKLANLRAAIDAADRAPDVPDFSFAELRAKLATEGRKRAKR
jgi:hypothetical protein